MKLLQILFVFACLSSVQAFSQQLNLSIGPSFPVGAFASKDGNDPASGLAKMGWMADISYSHGLRKSPHFGVTAILRGRLNSIDKEGMMAPFTESYPGYQWSASNSSWKTAALMGGAYYTTAISGKWSFTGTLAVGVAEAWLPEINLMAIVDSTGQGGDANLLLVNNKQAHATTFTMMAKAGVLYKLTEKLSLTASVDYWFLKPDFVLTQSVAFGRHMMIPGMYQLSNAASISTYSVRAPYSQQMNSFNLLVGVSMHL
ncbi:MAG TPA: hypothetical protein VHC48_14505 [Puia sp.]|nr:hypothetical protein [Puia sp.]